jgi:hypothetical protein
MSKNKRRRRRKRKEEKKIMDERDIRKTRVKIKKGNTEKDEGRRETTNNKVL